MDEQSTKYPTDPAAPASKAAHKAHAPVDNPELQVPEDDSAVGLDIDLDAPQPDAPRFTPKTARTVESYIASFEKKDVLSFLFQRRSVRKFLKKPVEADYLELLLMAAMSAPSANNKRPWEFIVADRPEDVKRIRGALVFGRYSAPAAIVVCGNLKKTLPLQAREYWVQDCAAAMQSLLLAAAGIGLGGVWIGVYPQTINMALLRRALQLPEHVIPLGVAYLGYPEVQPEPRTQYDPACVYWLSDSGPKPESSALPPKRATSRRGKK